MLGFAQNGIPAVASSTINFTTSGIVIQPPNSGLNRIYITDIVASNAALTLTNASATASGSVLAYIAQGNCNLSAPIRVPNGSGVAVSTTNAIGTITYFLE